MTLDIDAIHQFERHAARLQPVVRALAPIIAEHGLESVFESLSVMTKCEDLQRLCRAAAAADREMKLNGAVQ